MSHPAAEPAPVPREDAHDRGRAREWLAVAFASLSGAGLLALLLVVARVPTFAPLVPDAGFFKRCLVVHVDLALVVWFYAFVAALFALVPARVRSTAPSRHAAYAAGAGAALLVVSAFARDARPVLANYIPVVDHPVFVGGLALLGLALATTFLDPKLLPRTETSAPGAWLPPSALVCVRASALAVLVALVTFAASAGSVTPGLAPETRWEQVMWGGGHVLQFASVAAMMAAWTVLVTRATGREPMSRGAAAALAALLVTPTLAGPPLALAGDHAGFTRLMQFAIAPAMFTHLALSARALWRTPGASRRPAALGFWASATLAVLGAALGASIHGPNTVVPAHYHASIGAVTVAFMAVTPALLEHLGSAPLAGRLERVARFQPALLGFGQAVFALGFALAGRQGMQRKAYGDEQHVRTAVEWLGLTVMGIGGLVAVAGGVLFLVIVGAMWRRRSPHGSRRGEAWPTVPVHTRSNA
ncbi:MAG: hypothetical protein IT376_00715 [Polyangiaceae bacterium]|nr:hypothetical protein [Polyangiaceae bacterium]